jgi:hypothetical protein
MAKKKLNAFERTFKKQRASGAKTFAFGGKQYNTKLAPGGGKKKTVTRTKTRVSTPDTMSAPAARPSEYTRRLDDAKSNAADASRRVRESREPPIGSPASPSPRDRQKAKVGTALGKAQTNAADVSARVKAARQPPLGSPASPTARDRQKAKVGTALDKARAKTKSNAARFKFGITRP